MVSRLIFINSDDDINALLGAEVTDTEAAFALCALRSLNISTRLTPILSTVRQAREQLAQVEIDNSPKGIRRSIRSGYLREVAELRAQNSRRSVEQPLREALEILEDYTADTNRVEAYECARKATVLAELRELGLDY